MLNYKDIYLETKRRDQIICNTLNSENSGFKYTITETLQDKSGTDIVMENADGIKKNIDTKYIGLMTKGKGRKYVEVYELIDPEYTADYIWYITFDGEIYEFEKDKLREWVESNKDKWETSRFQPTIIRKHGPVPKLMLFLNSYENIPGGVKKNKVFEFIEHA